MTAIHILYVAFAVGAGAAWGYFCGYNEGKAADAWAKHRAETERMANLESEPVGAERKAP